MHERVLRRCPVWGATRPRPKAATDGSGLCARWYIAVSPIDLQLKAEMKTRCPVKGRDRRRGPDRTRARRTRYRRIQDVHRAGGRRAAVAYETARRQHAGPPGEAQTG